MKYLVIVESPTKSKTIGKYLSKDYLVLASYGHIRSIPSKSNSVLPDEDFKIHYQLNKDALKRILAIKNAAKKADKVYLATDPDREGEAIAWHVCEYLREDIVDIKDRVERVVFYEITRTAILYAFEHTRSLDNDLINAQQARLALDYLIGFTLSPLLWKKVSGCRSAGRVQSSALRLICEREKEREDFVSQEYWSINADLLNQNDNKFTFQLNAINDKKLEKLAIKNKEAAEHIKQRLFDIKVFTVNKIHTIEKQRNPQAPFKTSTLQQDAVNKLHFSSKKTMMVAQKLYEGIEIDGSNVGLITYMRTDSVTIANEMIKNLRDYISQKFGKEYLHNSVRTYQNKVLNAQEAHEAIRPTNFEYTPEKLEKVLSPDEMKLYRLIWKRAIASQMSSAKTATLTVGIIGEEFTLQATNTVMLFQGFNLVYKNTDESTDNKINNLDILQKDSILTISDIISKQHHTEPKPRYTEASLVKELEHLGIGRPSTYSSIISVLQDRKYAILKNKQFIPEFLGRILSAFLTDNLNKYIQYDLTAKIEFELDKIASGKMNYKLFLKDFWYPFKTEIERVENHDTKLIVQALTQILSKNIFNNDNEKKCTQCGNNIILKFGRFGVFLSCSNYPECKNTRKINQEDSNNKGSAPVLVGVYKKEEVFLKNGPYGKYLEASDSKKKVSLPDNWDDLDLNLLLSLPRELMLYKDKSVILCIGKYGPYIKYNGVSINIKTHYSWKDLQQEDIEQIIASKKSKSRKRSSKKHIS